MDALGVTVGGSGRVHGREPGASGEPGAGTLTREELDAAEPESAPSASRRFLVGVVLGFLALAISGWAGAVAFVPVAAIPLAWTWAGAGVLVGFGLPGTVLVILQLAAQPLADAGEWIGVVATSSYVIGCLAVGIAAVLGRALAARLGYKVDETRLFRRRSARDLRR